MIIVTTELRCDGDGCGEKLWPDQVQADAPKPQEVRRLARRRGWVRTSERRDLCPACSARRYAS